MTKKHGTDIPLFIRLVLLLTTTVWSATYYIDYINGLNDNNGLSKTSAWKVHPYMYGFNGSYIHHAGDRFIFKGGVTWDHNCFQMSIAAGGSNSASDYYGVDSSWFAGNAWARPVFSGDHTHLAAGSSIVYISYAQDSCITFDNIEIKRHRSYANWGMGCVAVYCAPRVHLTNLWVHDWSLDTSVKTDDTHGGIIGNFPSCGGAQTWIDHCEISNAEAGLAGRQNGGATRSINIRYSKIHDVSAAMLFGVMHDCEVYNVGYPDMNKTFDPTFHTNAAYVAQWDGEGTVPAYVYNNLMHDIKSGSGVFYPSPGCAAVYLYNNVVWNNYWSLDVYVETEWASPTTPCGAVYIYNNTFQTSGIAVTPRGYKFGALAVQNNLFIDDNSGYLSTGEGVVDLVDNHNLIITSAQAGAQGYSASDLFAPPALSSVTVDAGVNLTCPSCPGFNADRRGIARPQGATWDIGAYEYVAGTAVVPLVHNHQTSPPATIRLCNGIFYITLPASARSPELTIVDISGRTVYRTALSATDRGDGVVYEGVLPKAPAAGAYFSIVNETTSAGKTERARTKIVVDR